MSLLESDLMIPRVHMNFCNVAAMQRFVLTLQNIRLKLDSQFDWVIERFEEIIPIMSHICP